MISNEPHLHFSESPSVAVDSLQFEIVERKGLGHPDSIADTIGVLVSSNYSKYTLQHFNQVLHHNIDKITISGGKAKWEWGGGELIEPISIIFVGRAIREVVNGSQSRVSIPLYKLAGDAVNKAFNHLDGDFLLQYSTNDVKEGSSDLITVVSQSEGSNVPLANDTSYTTSWAPLSKLERLVKDVESFLNSEYKKKHKALGTDIKVMGRRFKDEIHLNVAAAFRAPFLQNENEYLDEVTALHDTISERFSLPKDQIHVNTADNPEKKEYYVTVTGTSLEQGDDGQIGRGNRIRGVIAPYRPQTLEATAGKNPTSHVGNFFSIWASLISDKIYDELNVKNTVSLLSTIGKPITDCDVFVMTENNVDANKHAINDIVSSVVENWEQITNDIINNRIKNLYPFEFLHS